MSQSNRANESHRGRHGRHISTLQRRAATPAAQNTRRNIHHPSECCPSSWSKPHHSHLTFKTVSVGCKIYIRRQNPEGETEERLAEILSIRDKPTNPYAARRKKTAATTEDGGIKEEDADPNAKPEDKWEYFVHWESFNKRLDDWVAGSRLVLSRDLEWPRPKPPPGKPTKKDGAPQKAPGKAPRSQSLLKKATSNAAVAGGSGGSSVAPTPPPLATPERIPSPSLKRKTPHDEEEEEEPEDEDADAEGDMDVDGDGDGEGETFELNVSGAPQEEPQEEHSHFSKEQEIEKLRTSGSMTQSISEVARVKNLNRLQMGKHEFEAWYFSPYPKEYAHLPVLFLCEFCLAFFPSQMMLTRHRQRCTLLHPPGNEIYRHDDISFFEIDGKRQLTYCRNLSLLSKCFLDQ